MSGWPRVIRLLALTLVVAAALQAAYSRWGPAFVGAQYAHPAGPFLFNLIAAPGPHTLAEYLSRANDLWLTFQLTWIGLVVVFVAAPSLEPVTARLHRVCLEFGDQCARHSHVFLGVGAAAVTVATALIGWLTLLHFPNSGDEYGYLYEAQTLLAGRFSNPPHPLQAFFATSHVIERDGHVFGVFPPGFGLIIAAASLFQVPAWAINPLLSGGLFVLTFHLSRRITDHAATAALAAITLPLSSYFLMTGASFFSHTACAFLVVGAMLAMLRMTEGRRWSAVVAGLLAGLAMITRYYTPILCLLPLSVALWRERHWRTEYLWALAGGSIPVLFLLAYNHALTGNPLMLSKGGVEQYDQLWFAEGTWHRGAEFMLAHLWDLVLWTPPALLIAYIVSLRTVPLLSRLGAVGAGFATLALGLYPYMNRGGNQYGPRFYFDGYPLLVIAAAVVLFGSTPFEGRSRRGRRLVYLAFVSLLVHLPIAAHQLSMHHQDVIERLDVTRQVERAHLQHALVFVTTAVGTDRPMPPTDYIRNGVTYDASVLYAMDLGDENRALEDYYADRACFTYAYDRAQQVGSLTPCRR